MIKKIGILLIVYLFMSTGIRPALADPPPSRGTVTLGNAFPKSPNSPISDIGSEVSFTWENVPGATHYSLWIEESNGNPIKRPALTPEQANCKLATIAICSFPVTLTDNSGKWWVRAEKHSADNSRVEALGNYIPMVYKTLATRVERCIMRIPLTGDVPNFLWGYGGLGAGDWSVGPAISAQLIKYDFGKKKAGFNTGVGAGAAFRFYTRVPFIDDETLEEKLGENKYGMYKDKTPDGIQGDEVLIPIHHIKEECRAQNLTLVDEGSIASPLFSITPTIYVTEPTGDDLRVEPAILLGLFKDIVNVGVGFNLTGNDGDVGDVFLLFSLGVGFQF